MTFELGLWRSAQSTQATHVVWEPAGLVGCFSAEGGPQQPLARPALDAILEAALARWLATPAPTLEGYFAEIQRGFDAAPDDHQATGVAVIVEPARATIASLGIERAYRWRPGDDALEQLTVDDSLATRNAHVQHPEWFRHTGAAAFRRGDPDPARWTTTTVELVAGDRLVLVCGLGDTGLDLAYLSGALREGAGGAQQLADGLGAAAARFAAASPKTERAAWKIHSRLALAIVCGDDQMM